MKNWEFLRHFGTPEFVKREISNSRVRPARNLQLTTSSEQKYELSSSSKFVQREIYNSRLRQSRNTNSQVRPSQHEIDEFNSSVPPSWSPSLATATRLRWSTVCWTKLPRRVQTISHLLEDALLCRLLQSPFMQEWKNQFKFRYFARNTVFCRCRVQTISHLLEDALLLPTASITIYAGTKESILISVFRAQNSFSSLTNTISLF